MPAIHFFKMTGAGNDFVLVNGGPKLPGSRALAARLCDRRHGIGADGLLIVDARSRTPRISYFNADGSAAFCGNGTRCAAWWLYKHGKAPSGEFVFTASGTSVLAKITGKERAAVLMPRPGRPRLGLKVRAGGRALLAHWIRAGVPHAIIETRSPASAPLERLGPPLRRNKAFGREGANIDFARYEKNRVVLRTYERGVEAETLACGTGAVAAACVGRALGRLRGNSVPVLAAGGDVLRVEFTPHGEVWLEGPAREVFSGEIKL